MKLLLGVFKWILIITGLLTLCLATIVFFTNRAQDAAQASATDFCAQAAIGADLSAPIVRAKSMGLIRHYPWCEAKRYVFFFQGSTFNGYDCVLTVDSGKVTAKKVIEHLDEDEPDKVCR